MAPHNRMENCACDVCRGMPDGRFASRGAPAVDMYIIDPRARGKGAYCIFCEKHCAPSSNVSLDTTSRVRLHAMLMQYDTLDPNVIEQIERSRKVADAGVVAVAAVKAVAQNPRVRKAMKNLFGRRRS